MSETKFTPKTAEELSWHLAHKVFEECKGMMGVISASIETDLFTGIASVKIKMGEPVKVVDVFCVVS